MMQQTFLTRFSTWLILGLFTLASSHIQAATDDNTNGIQPLDRVAVVVNDTPILLSDLNQAVASARKTLAKNNETAPNPRQLQQQVLNNLINRSVQEHAAQQRNITVDNALVNEEIASIAQRNHLSLSQLKQQIEADGTPFAEFRNIIKHKLMLRQLLRIEVYRKVSVSEQDVDDYLLKNNDATDQNKYQLQHILISTPKDATPDQVKKAQAKAAALLMRIDKGESFTSVAQTASDGQQAANGGQLGWLTLKQMPSIFVSTVKLMDKGDVFKPIVSPNGVHILKVADMQGEPRVIVKQANVRHILVKPTLISSDEDVKNTLLDLKKRLEQGENFAVLAKVYSDDGSANDGGNLGWANPDQYVPEFKQAVNTLPLNTVSAPIHTQFGWHLVEVLDRRDYDETKERRRNEVRMLLREQRAKEQQNAWLAQLRDEAYIDYRIKSLELPAL